MEKTHHINTSQKKAGAVILMSVKNKKYHYGWGKISMIKESIL